MVEMNSVYRRALVVLSSSFIEENPANDLQIAKQADGSLLGLTPQESPLLCVNWADPSDNCLRRPTSFGCPLETTSTFIARHRYCIAFHLTLTFRILPALTTEGSTNQSDLWSVLLLGFSSQWTPHLPKTPLRTRRDRPRMCPPARGRV